MQTREWRTIDKAGWGPGPWQDEPDKAQWQDEATGLPCLMVRNPSSGNWCGYVGVAEGHPAFKKGYDYVDVDVHGGLTFADLCQPHEDGESRGICHVPGPGAPDHIWWLGFDCAHSFDKRPGSDAQWPQFFDHDAMYRDAVYVAAQCRALAAQLHGLRPAATEG